MGFSARCFLECHGLAAVGEILNLYIRSPLLKKAIRVPESGVRYFLSALRYLSADPRVHDAQILVNED